MEVEDVGPKWAALEVAGWTGPLFEHDLTQRFTLQARDRFGASLLHRAARSPSCSPWAFSRILEHLPSPAPQVEFLTYDGCTALHYAAAQGNAFAAHTLLRLYPPAAGIADDKGYTPLHRALTKKRESTYEIVYALLKAYPQAVTMREQQGNLLPLHLAVNAGHDTKTIKLLITVCASAAACSDRGKANKKSSSPSLSQLPGTATSAAAAISAKKTATAAAPSAEGEGAGVKVKTCTAPPPAKEDVILSFDEEHFQRSAKLARARVAQQMKEKEEAHRQTAFNHTPPLAGTAAPAHTPAAPPAAGSVQEEIMRLMSSADEDAAADLGVDRAPSADPLLTSTHASRRSSGASTTEEGGESEFVLQVINEEAERPSSARQLSTSPLDVLTRFLSHSTMKPDLPLHMALRCKTIEWESVLALLEVLPAAAGVPDSLKMWPLFTAIRKRAPARVVKALIEAHPAVLFVRERVLPDSQSDSTAGARGAMAAAFTEAAAAVDENEGLSALQLALDTYSHIAAKKEEKEVCAAVLSKEQIKALADAAALQFKEDCASIIALVRAFPLGAFDRQAVTHALPFDYAVQKRMWPVCVYLLQYCLKKKRDSSEDTLASSLSDCDPLVDALNLDAPLHVLRLILEVFPDAATYERENLQWPLHTACTMCSDGDAVLLVLRSFTPAALCCDYFEKYPMHYLCEGRADPRMAPAEAAAAAGAAAGARNLERHRSAVLAVHEVAQAHPAVLSIPDNKKRIPFSIARSFHCSAGVMHALLYWLPDPVAKNDANGKMPFWNIIAEGVLDDITGIGFELAAVFLAHSLPVLRGQGLGSPNSQYRGAWHDVLAEPSDIFHALIERTLDDVGLVHMLAAAKHRITNWPGKTPRRPQEESVTALEAASSASRHLLLRRMFLFSRFQLPPARDPAAVAPVPAHTTSGGTYYQDQKSDAVPPSSPVRLKAAHPHRAISAGEQAAAKSSPPQASPEQQQSNRNRKDRFVCGLIAKDQLRSTKKVGILFCKSAEYKDAIHKAELRRAHSQGEKLSKMQIQTMKREVNFTAFLAEQAVAAAEAAAVSTAIVSTDLPAGDEPAKEEVQEKLEIEEGEKAIESVFEGAPAERAPLVPAAEPNSVHPAVEPAIKCAAAAIDAEPSADTDASLPLLAPSPSAKKPDWWQQYLQGPEQHEWLDCEAENVRHMTMDPAAGAGNKASRGGGEAGAILTLHRSPSALGVLALGLVDPWETPAASLALLGKTGFPIHAEEGAIATEQADSATPTPAAPPSPGRFLDGTFQTTVAPHHGYPLVCTKPLELQHEFVREQLERALGPDYSTHHPTFCAVFSEVSDAGDLQAIMRWMEESVLQSELPKPMPVPVLCTSPLGPSAPSTPEQQPETDAETEVDWEAALQRAEESSVEVAISALMLQAAKEHLLEQDSVVVAITPIEPRVAVELEPPVIQEPEAEPEPEPLVPSAPPSAEKSSAPTSPRSESLSRKSKTREYVKPPIQQTHRNKAEVPAPTAAKPQTRMKEKSRRSLKGADGAANATNATNASSVKSDEVRPKKISAILDEK